MNKNLLLLVILLINISEIMAQENPWKGPSVNFSHGKLKVSENKRFLVISDQDLIELLKISIARRWEPGRDFGIISYDDTPLKEILSGGISVISTDFKKMGETAAVMIKSKINEKRENPCLFIARKSL